MNHTECVPLVHVGWKLVGRDGRGDEVEPTRQIESMKRYSGTGYRPEIPRSDAQRLGAPQIRFLQDRLASNGDVSTMVSTAPRAGLAALATLTACGFPQVPPPAPGTVAVTGVTVIDGTGAPPLPGVTVVVTGGRIVSVDPNGPVPAGALIINGIGKYLIPGLWDMHVHTSWDRHFTIPLFVANGVTGVRDMFGKDPAAIRAVRTAISGGRLVGPRIVTAGRILDGQHAAWPGSLIVEQPRDADRAVAETLADGADFVKVYSSLDRAVYFAIADAARRRGIPFVGHVPRSVTIDEASDAGQKSIEHLTGLDLDAAPSTLDSLFARFRRNGTWQTPTLTVLGVGADPGSPTLIANPNLRYVPHALRGLWGLARRMVGGDTSGARAAARRRAFEQQLAIVGRMYRDSVDLLAGTDEPNPFTIPGFSIHEELGLLVQAGLPPMAALQAATRNPARFLGAEDSLGTIAPGKLADLVLLNANPLEDIGNTRKIAAVVLRGRVLGRAALDSMLAAVEADRWRPSVAARILSGAIARRVPAVVIVGAVTLMAAVLVTPIILIWRRRQRRLGIH